MADTNSEMDTPVDTVAGSIHAALVYSDKRMQKYGDCLVAAIDSLQMELEHFTSIRQSIGVVRTQLQTSNQPDCANRVVSQRLRKLMHQISEEQLTEMDFNTTESIRRKAEAFRELHATAVLLRMAEKSATASRNSPELVVDGEVPVDAVGPEASEKVKLN